MRRFGRFLGVVVVAAVATAAPAAAADQGQVGGTYPHTTIGAGANSSFNVDFDAPIAAVTGLTVYVSAVGVNGTTVAGDSVVTVRPRMSYPAGPGSTTLLATLTPAFVSEQLLAGNVTHVHRYDVSGLAGVTIRVANADTVSHSQVQAWWAVERNYEGQASPLPIDCVAGCDGGGEPTEVAGTVALSSADRERLDLGWWGAWAIVGCLLVLMIAPSLMSAMRTDRGL